jgi:hypothetical protein
MDVFKEEVNIHGASSEMSTLNEECFNVINSEGNQEAIARNADKVFYLSGLTYTT